MAVSSGASVTHGVKGLEAVCRVLDSERADACILICPMSFMVSFYDIPKRKMLRSYRETGGQIHAVPFFIPAFAFYTRFGCLLPNGTRSRFPIAPVEERQMSRTG